MADGVDRIRDRAGDPSPRRLPRPQIMLLEVIEHYLLNRQDVVDKALELTAKRFGMDLDTSENSISPLTKMYPYQNTNREIEKTRYVDESVLLFGQINTSIFQIGSAKVSNGDQKRLTVEEIQPDFRGAAVVTQTEQVEKKQLHVEYVPPKLLASNTGYPSILRECATGSMKKSIEPLFGSSWQGHGNFISTDRPQPTHPSTDIQIDITCENGVVNIAADFKEDSALNFERNFQIVDQDLVDAKSGAMIGEIGCILKGGIEI